MNDNTSETTEDAAPSTSAIGVINTDAARTIVGNTTTSCMNNSSISSSRSTSSSNSSTTAGCLLSLSNDARLEFVTSYTLTSLRLKHDKWHKMMATQEYQYIALQVPLPQV
ncbi:hypothetical protein DOY81_007833 [Sarcophaga bullata]|nr:hypothetical protein DOY81_007833 [Sarcophaga bullata]